MEPPSDGGHPYRGSCFSVRPRRTHDPPSLSTRRSGCTRRRHRAGAGPHATSPTRLSLLARVSRYRSGRALVVSSSSSWLLTPKHHELGRVRLEDGQRLSVFRLRAG